MADTVYATMPQQATVTVLPGSTNPAPGTVISLQTYCIAFWSSIPPTPNPNGVGGYFATNPLSIANALGFMTPLTPTGWNFPFNVAPDQPIQVGSGGNSQDETEDERIMNQVKNEVLGH